MNNVFNKDSVSYGIRMIVKGDKRSLVRDPNYFISSNISIKNPSYTLCGSSGSGFESYAVLNRQNVVMNCKSVNNKRTNIQIDNPNYAYLVVSGRVEHLEELMVMDEEIKYNPPYEDFDGNIPSESGNPGMVFTVSGFTFVPQFKRYRISGVTSSLIKSYSDLPNVFIVYVPFLTSIVAESVVSIYDTDFQLCYADWTPVSETVDAANNVIPIYFDKSEKKALLPYSSVISVSNEDEGVILSIR